LKSEKIDGIINLAGMNLGAKRWSKKVKKEIYDSRINITAELFFLISEMNVKPEVMVSASGVDYYGDTGDKDIYENNHPGNSFLAKVVNDWEREALKSAQHGVRAVCLRTGLVFGADSENNKKLFLPYKLFI